MTNFFPIIMQLCEGSTLSVFLYETGNADTDFSEWEDEVIPISVIGDILQGEQERRKKIPNPAGTGAKSGLHESRPPTEGGLRLAKCSSAQTPSPSSQTLCSEVDSGLNLESN